MASEANLQVCGVYLHCCQRPPHSLLPYILAPCSFHTRLIHHSPLPPASTLPLLLLSTPTPTSLSNSPPFPPSLLFVLRSSSQHWTSNPLPSLPRRSSSTPSSAKQTPTGPSISSSRYDRICFVLAVWHWFNDLFSTLTRRGRRRCMVELRWVTVVIGVRWKLNWWMFIGILGVVLFKVSHRLMRGCFRSISLLPPLFSDILSSWLIYLFSLPSRTLKNVEIPDCSWSRLARTTTITTMTTITN